MAYKFSVGAYAHSGSLSAASDITGSTTVSGAVGQFGTLTVATFSPANISSTNITASSNMSASTANFNTLTVGTFSPTNLTVTNDLVVSGNTTLGNLTSADLTVFNSKVSSSLLPVGSQNLGDPAAAATDLWKVYASTISGSSTLQVGGISTLQAVNAQAVTASSNMSASTANFGTLTVGTFSPANISTTTLTVTGVTTLSGNVALGDAPADVITVNGQITGSLFQINGGTINATTIGASTQSSGKFTTLSASSTLDVVGTLTVAGATTLNGDLTVNGAITYVSSSVVEFKDVNLILASGSTTSLQVNGAGLTLGNTGYQLKFVSGSMGTTGDSWQFSGSTGLTDFAAGNITGTSLLNTKIVESIESSSTATINISKFITLADSTAADITANLPAAGPSFIGLTYKVKNVGTRSVFVKSLGGTIDGVAAATGVTLGTQYAAATFACDGTNWFIF
jgi:hypothetical protein